MPAAARFEREVHGGVLTVAVVERDGVDIGALLGDGRRDRREHAALVLDLDPDAHREHGLDVLLPLDIDPLFRVLAKLDHVRTILGVHHDPAPRGQETENRIARYRPAAARIGHHHALGAADGERRRLVARRPALEQSEETMLLPGFDLGRLRHELTRHHRRQPVAESDFAEQLVPVEELEGFQQGLTAFLGQL